MPKEVIADLDSDSESDDGYVGTSADFPRECVPGVHFHICKTWNGSAIDHRPTEIDVGWYFEKQLHKPFKRVVTVSFFTPLFDDPEPPELPGILSTIHEFEMFMIILANDREQFIEIAVGPHGHWLVRLFDGIDNCFNDGEELELTTTNAWVGGDMWKGRIEIPLAYLPANVAKLNCFRVYGTGDERVTETLRPLTDGTCEKPDFHRLDFFRRVDRSKFIPEQYNNITFKDWKYGDVWENHY